MANDKTEIMGDPADPAAIEDLEQQCPNCQAEMLAGQQFCPKCGYQRGTWQATGESREAAGEARPAVFELRSAAGGAWSVYAGENEIGRGDVQIQVDNPYASRLHARIVVDDDGAATIEDLGSSNGTLVAGEAIEANQSQPLEPGIEFTIGEESFTLEQVSEAEAAETKKEESAPDAAAADEAPDESDTEQAVDEPEPQAVAEEPEADAAEAETDLVMSPWSLVIGDGLERRLPVGETIIGRKAGEGGIVIDKDGYVSGIHCKVSAGMDNLSIEDLGSTNGTKVAEQQLAEGEPAELSPGDVVTVGQTEIEVRLDDGSEQDEPEPETETDEAGAEEADTEAAED